MPRQEQLEQMDIDKEKIQRHMYNIKRLNLFFLIS